MRLSFVKGFGCDFWMTFEIKKPCQWVWQGRASEIGLGFAGFRGEGLGVFRAVGGALARQERVEVAFVECQQVPEFERF